MRGPSYVRNLPWIKGQRLSQQRNPLRACLVFKYMKIIKCVWIDTCHYPDQTGIVDVIMEKARPREVIDVGYLIGEDETRVVIATVKKEGGRFNKITAIFKPSIKEIVVLEE